MSKLVFVQELSYFEVRDFGRISYKKTDKIDILRYFTPNLSARAQSKRTSNIKDVPLSAPDVSHLHLERQDEDFFYVMNA